MQASHSRLLRTRNPSAYVCPSCRHALQAVTQLARLSTARTFAQSGQHHHVPTHPRSSSAQRCDRKQSRNTPVTRHSSEYGIDRSRSPSTHSSYDRARGLDCQAGNGAFRNTARISKTSRPVHSRRTQCRNLQTTASNRLELTTPTVLDNVPSFPHRLGGIRARLRQWEIDHANDEPLEDVALPRDKLDPEEPISNSSRLGETRTADVLQEPEEENAPLSGNEGPDFQGRDATAQVQLVMGDLVLLNHQASDRFLTAVFIRRAGEVSQFYTSLGKWVHVSFVNVKFAIPGWAPRDLIEPILPHLPNEEEMVDGSKLVKSQTEDVSVPRDFGMPLIAKLHAFEEEAAAYYRAHAAVLDGAHEALAHTYNLRYSTITSVAMYLLKLKRNEVTPLILFVVCRVLHMGGVAFSFDNRSSSVTGLLQIRSRQQVLAVQRVSNWIREWQDAKIASHSVAKTNPIPAFLQKARRIVMKSRETREPTQHEILGPSKIKFQLSRDQNAVQYENDEKWDKDEKVVISFLEMWALNRLFQSSDSLRALGSVLLNILDLYNGHELNSMTGVMFMQEIGLIPPYVTRVEYDPNLALPTSQHSQPLLELALKLVRDGKSPDGFVFKDSMQDLRHDWGNMPVYCIDGLDAREIDDGVSIEAGATPDQTWVHIHIANPTAFVSQDEDICKMARHMGETVYTPDRNHMMLPPRATQRWWSLAPDRPTLTVSARLSESGDILETRVCNGRVHNVIRLTYDQVDHILDPDKPAAQKITITVGGDPPPIESASSRSNIFQGASIKEDLSRLATIANARDQHRVRGGAIVWNHNKPDLKVWTRLGNPGLEYLPINRVEGRRTYGDPIIQLTTTEHGQPFVKDTSASHSLIQEMMLLASEAAAAWAAERQVPLLYRGTIRHDASATVYWDTVCAPAVEKYGFLPEHVGLQYVKQSGATVISTEALRHGILGMQSYTKVTSPLRRYGDMVAHWQIEATLREEARLGKSMVTSDPAQPRAFLPFSKQALESFMISYHARERLIGRTKRSAEQSWLHMLLIRAHHFGEAKLPLPSNTFTVHVKLCDMMSLTRMVAGDILEFNVPCAMTLPHMHGMNETVKAGDVWEAEFSTIKLTGCYVKPIRLLSRYDE